jgi:ATP-dependent DNA helicase PIF1
MDRQKYFSERAVLVALNVDVDKFNNTYLHRLEGESRTYLDIDTAVDEAGEPDHSIPKEFLTILNLSNIPSHSITLKEGCLIILLHNLDPSKGLCNGTRLIVTKLRECVIEAMILSDTHAGYMTFISRLTLLTSQRSTGLSFCLKHHQFPIRVTFGISINKSQEQSLRVVGIYLATPVFAHDRLYITLSQTINCRYIYISLPTAMEATKNIIYTKILTRTTVED